MTARVAYVNGELVPEGEAKVSIRDNGLVYGDSVFDTARTFGGRLFRLEDHVDRLMDSLAYVRIDPGMTRDELVAATERTVAANAAALREGEDWWVTIRVTSGVQNFDGEPPANRGATVAIDCIPLPLRARANFFRDGIPAVIPARRRVAPEAVSPNAKTNNYLNMVLAQKEVSAISPGAWALMLDPRGNIAEGPGANFFIVRDDRVATPTREFVLAGVSRAVVLDICADAGIACEERDVTLHDAMTADEAFFTSTSLCACPVSRINGKAVGGASVPGPVTKAIMDGFADVAGYDYVGQYLAFATAGGANPGL